MLKYFKVEHVNSIIFIFLIRKVGPIRKVSHYDIIIINGVIHKGIIFSGVVKKYNSLCI